jgi:hypothetical protein
MGQDSTGVEGEYSETHIATSELLRPEQREAEIHKRQEHDES